jgi:hypothetical protein
MHPSISPDAGDAENAFVDCTKQQNCGDSSAAVSVNVTVPTTM